MRELTFVRMTIETFERSVLMLPLQVSSCTPPPATRMEGMLVETQMMPDIQFSLAKTTRSLIQSTGTLI